MRLPAGVLGCALALVLGASPAWAQKTPLFSDFPGFSGDDPLSSRPPPSRDDPPAQVQLLAREGALNSDGEAILGVRIHLQEGWKTYWRNPGDSGIPPLFDWSGSQNLAHAEVLWPAPDRFDNPGDSTYGYGTHVVFPVRVRAADPSLPLEANLDLDYAACNEVCVPMEARLDQVVYSGAESGATRVARAEAAEIEASLALVPDGRGRTEDMHLDRARLVRTPAGTRALDVLMTSPAPLRAPRLVVEGPQGVYFGVPKLLDNADITTDINAGGGVRFRMPVNGPGAADLIGQMVWVTFKDDRSVLSGALSVE